MDSPELISRLHWKRRAVSALILFHLIVVPLGSQLTFLRANRTGIEKLIADYVYAIRVRQYWALFSPEPRKDALRYSAILTLKDGSSKTWSRPYPPNWGFFERHHSYHFQKWDLVGNYLDQKSMLWNSLTRFLLKTQNDSFNPIVKIEFLKSYAPWPAPQPHGYVGGEAKDLQWTAQTLFTFDVSGNEYR